MRSSITVFLSLIITLTFVPVGFWQLPAAISGAADKETSGSLSETPRVTEPIETGSSNGADFAIGPAGTEGADNTFYGNLAGDGNSGSNCTFIGADAGSGGNSGSSNTFLGNGSGWKNTGGGSNTFMGRYAGALNSDGNNNTFIGRAAGYNNSGGHENVCIGSRAGYNVNGNGNVFIGSHVGYNKQSTDNKLYIDNSGTSDNPLIWGDFDTNDVVIYGGFRAISSHSASDKRWKKNIQPLTASLDKISGLQGVSFEWDTDQYPDMGMKKGKQIGLVAQDVEKKLPELVSEDKDGYKAVSYDKLAAVLVEAVKELKRDNERQREEIKRQQAEIEKLRALIEERKS